MEGSQSREPPTDRSANERTGAALLARARASTPHTIATRFAHTYTSSPHTQNSWPEGVVGLTLKIEKPASCSKNRTPCDDFCLLSYPCHANRQVSGLRRAAAAAARRRRGAGVFFLWLQSILYRVSRSTVAVERQ